MRKIIYAAYGSNLLKERFLVYIKGGSFMGREYKGCKDKTDPIDRGWKLIPYRLYFAKKSKRWGNKGVAFIKCKKEVDEKYHTVVRLWEITEEQFNDIWEQEGKTWYYKKRDLGEKDGLKIYTLTGSWLKEINPPSDEYIEVMRKGLKETTGWDEKKIDEYLSLRKNQR